MSAIYDLVIVGGGSAGLAAGVYGSRAKLSTLIIQNGGPGGQGATTSELENYPGFGRGTTGPALMAAMADHAKSFGTEIVNDEVTDLDLESDIKVVTTKKGTQYQGKAIILAPGAQPRMLDIKGERGFRGKGVSYCATCDADFFEELDICVVGNGDAAIEEACYLTKFAESVTIIVIHDEGILDCNRASAEKAFENPKIKWVWNAVLEEIKGDGLVESVAIKNIKTGEISEMETNGVFFFVGTIPKTKFLEGKVQMNPQGYIETNDIMETNIPGVYAAGDARVKYLRQVITAASDGAIAAQAASKYMEELETFHKNVLEPEETVLAAFWAPQVEESFDFLAKLEGFVSDKTDKVKLAKFDTYRNQMAAKKANVAKVPCVAVFKAGQVVATLDTFDEEQLNQLI